jgi:hypothetical protein
MSTALKAIPTSIEIEQVLLAGDLSKLSPDQRLAYYNQICASLGLNPLTQPFAYITLNGKLRLYALKDATEQLRKIHGVSITAVSSQRIDDVFVVTASAQDRSGRTDAATGAVAVGNLKGEALANALMKAETKAKRRATLSICGLGMLDELEAETIPKAPTYTVEAEKPEPKALAEMPADTCRVLKVEPKRKGNFEWADVTYVTHHGEEKTAVAKMGLVALLEAFAQDNVVCEITATTNSKGKAEIDEVKRYRAEPATAPEPAVAEVL